MDDCIFCKIVAGTIPSSKVYEDEHTLAFMDIFPGVDGHTLVIPKQHAADIFAIDPDALAAVARTVKKVAHGLQRAYAIDGLNLFQSNGAAAFQSVFHLHVHVFPRRDGDDIRLPWTPKSADKDKLARIAEKLQAAIAQTSASE